MSLVQSNRSKRSKIQNKVNSRKKRKADTKTKKTNIKHQNLLFKSISTQMSCESSFNKKKLLQTILSMKSGLKRKIFVEKDSLLCKFSYCGGFGLFLFFVFVLASQFYSGCLWSNCEIRDPEKLTFQILSPPVLVSNFVDLRYNMQFMQYLIILDIYFKNV